MADKTKMAAQNNSVSILKFVPLESLKSLLESLYKFSGLSVIITDNKANQILSIGQQAICKNFYRKHRISLKNCIESDQHINSAEVSDSFTIYKCRNGLYDAACPLVVDKKHIATLIMGQFFYKEEKTDQEYFIKQAELYGFNKEKYRQALAAVPIFPKQKIESILELSKNIASNIAAIAQASKDLQEREIILSESRLKEALEYNQKITETSPVSIVVVNKNGQIEFANTRAEKTLGLVKKDITKRTYNDPDWKIKDFEGNDFPHNELPFIRVQKENKAVFNIEHAIEWADGRMAYLSINAAPKLDVNNNFDGMIATLENITDRVLGEREFKEVSSFREMLIKNAAEGLCVCHDIEEFPYVEFTVWNKQIEKITGYTLSEINKFGWYQSLYKNVEIRERAMLRMASMREGDDILNEEWDIVTKDNEHKTISISTSIISTLKGTTHVLALISDITALKLQRESIKKHNQELEKLNEIKDKFLSILSHDLKGPMGSQMQLLKHIAEESNELSKEELLRYIKVFSESNKSSYNLLDNILNWIVLQLEKSKVSVETCSLQESINETLDIFKENLLWKNLKVSTKLDYNTIKTNKNILNTVLRNLISNSIKFSNTGGTITLSAQKANSELVLSVRDKGVGMEDATKSKLFNLEKTISRKGTNREPGNGLGLSICKDLVASLGGKIWVESELGKGSTFFFSIPGQ